MLRTRNYSTRTITTYVQWIKRFILFHDKTLPADRERGLLPVVRGGAAGGAVSGAGQGSELTPVRRLADVPSLKIEGKELRIVW